MTDRPIIVGYRRQSRNRLRNLPPAGQPRRAGRIDGAQARRWPGSGKATGRAESFGAVAPAGYDQGGEHRGIVRVSGAELLATWMHWSIMLALSRKRRASGLEVKLAAVRETLETNTLAPLHLSQALVPLLKRSKAGRIVNISSGMGQLSDMEGGYAAYRISKTALNAVTAILAAELRGAVAVNAVCPGWVKTDMGGKNAEREVSQGAAGAVWLALDAPQDFTGNFTRDGKVIPW